MLPGWSKATPFGPRREALDARPPSPSGPRAPVPTGVVSLPVGLTLRTAPPANAPGVVLSAGVRSETYSEPPADATPHGIMATLVALAGPPTPPATVEMFPEGAAWLPRAAGPPAEAGCAGPAPRTAAGTSATPDAAARTVNQPATPARDPFRARSALLAIPGHPAFPCRWAHTRTLTRPAGNAHRPRAVFDRFGRYPTLGVRELELAAVP